MSEARLVGRSKGKRGWMMRRVAMGRIRIVSTGGGGWPYVMREDICSKEISMREKKVFVFPNQNMGLLRFTISSCKQLRMVMTTMHRVASSRLFPSLCNA